MLNHCINDNKFIRANADDLNECKNLCSYDKKCKAIAYKSNTKKCIIYHRCRKGTYEKWGNKFYYKNPTYCPDNFSYAYNKNNSFCCKTPPIENDMFCENNDYKRCSGERCFTKYKSDNDEKYCPISHKYAYHDYNGFCCKTVPVEGNKGCNNDDYAVCPHTNVHDGSKKTCISNDKDIDSLSNNYFRSNN